MGDAPDGDITVLLRAVKDGLPGAADRLMTLVYDRLKQIARNRVGAVGVRDLEPTTLVHETYLKMFGKDEPSWENRNHFFWAAARAMRDILVDRARRHSAEKRGGGRRHLPICDDIPHVSEAEDLLALNDAIQKLETVHPTSARVVILRFFAGLTREQIVEITGLSASAVWREWTFAKAWLLAEMSESDASGPSASA